MSTPLQLFSSPNDPFYSHKMSGCFSRLDLSNVERSLVFDSKDERTCTIAQSFDNCYMVLLRKRTNGHVAMITTKKALFQTAIMNNKLC